MLLCSAGLLVLCDLGLTVTISFVQKKLSIELERFSTFQTNILSQQAAGVSYERFCSKEYQNQRRELDELSEETGANLFSVVDLTKKMIASITSCLLAIVTISSGFVEIFSGHKLGACKLALTGLLAINILLVFISVKSARRVYQSKDCSDAELLRSYKISWYLDREYLRFKKTAKEIRIFNLEKRILELFTNADDEITRIKKNYERTYVKECVIADFTKQVSNLVIVAVYGFLAILGSITIGGFNRLSQISRNMYDNIIELSTILLDSKRIGKWLHAFWDYYDIERTCPDLISKQSDENYSLPYL